MIERSGRNPHTNSNEATVGMEVNYIFEYVFNVLGTLFAWCSFERFVFLMYFLTTRKRTFYDVRAYIRKVRFWWVKREIESLCKARIPVIEKMVYDTLRLDRLNDTTVQTSTVKRRD